jgi:hypothetical protein
MRVLVLIQGPLGDRLSGPEIRGWETARAFAQRHSVTALADVVVPEVREGIRIVPRSRRGILREIRRHDVVIGPVLPPYALLALARRRRVRVADLYDPVDLEVGTADGLGARLAVACQRAGRRLHLRWSDVVVSANAAQTARTQADLAGLRRMGPGPALATVPMGVPAPPAPTSATPLRDRFPAIGADDPVVLWWGSIWRWLDAPTAIDAIAEVAAARPDVRLVFTAGRPSNSATDKVNATEEARAHARNRNVLDQNVFFFDDWIPFDDRAAYLRDADLGLTLHRDTAEAPLAARARYMDYVWSGLPAVLAEGDETADRFADGGAASLVPAGDPSATARAIVTMLADPGELQRSRQACEAVAAEFRWEHVMADLVERVESLPPRAFRAAGTMGIAVEAGCYYLRRAIERMATAGT